MGAEELPSSPSADALARGGMLTDEEPVAREPAEAPFCRELRL